MLHGYTYTAAMEDKFLGLGKTASDKGFLYALPDGTKDDLGLQFWNATDGCCNLYGSTVDDVAYLKAVLKDVKRRYNVDSKRVFLIGHSNGGFMSYRMACEDADEIAGIVSLAGATWMDPSRCRPSSPVTVLELHGDMDTVIKYDGGQFAQSLAPYPSAHATVAQWAKLDGCTGMLTTSGAPTDVDNGIPGAETRVESYGGCPHSAVALWTMQGGGHFPDLQPTWGGQVYQFLMDNPKP
jgi:polyhydroxybutyrate depolymerase